MVRPPEKSLEPGVVRRRTGKLEHRPFEYLLQVPANRIGHTTLSLGQLKILQEVISLSVFVPFTLLYMKESLSWNYLYAAFCIAGAVFFIFRG